MVDQEGCWHLLIGGNLCLCNVIVVEAGQEYCSILVGRFKGKCQEFIFNCQDSPNLLSEPGKSRGSLPYTVYLIITSLCLSAIYSICTFLQRWRDCSSRSTTGAVNTDRSLCHFLVAALHLNKIPQVGDFANFLGLLPVYPVSSHETILFKLHVFPCCWHISVYTVMMMK